jgi:hypothetical protein
MILRPFEKTSLTALLIQRLDRERQELIMSISRDEWMKRYKERVREVCEMSQDNLDDLAESVDVENLSEDELLDPEDAADNEMECWTDDGDDDGVLI